MSKSTIGGSFAPPLSDETIAAYKARIAALPSSPVKDACGLLLTCCEKWWALPEPVGTHTAAHPSGAGIVVKMQPEHVAALDQHIPWGHELDALGGEKEGKPGLFDAIDPVKDAELRNMAFHLLWVVRELNLDREPLTTDKV
jgi:hypothetical protein